MSINNDLNHRQAHSRLHVQPTVEHSLVWSVEIDGERCKSFYNLERKNSILMGKICAHPSMGIGFTPLRFVNVESSHHAKSTAKPKENDDRCPLATLGAMRQHGHERTIDRTTAVQRWRRRLDLEVGSRCPLGAPQ